MKEKLKIFKNHSFRNMFLANFASEVGTVIGTTAFVFYILKEFSEKPHLATIAEMTNYLPLILVFFLIGVVADRFDRQKIAYHSDSISAVLSLILLIAVYIQSIPLMFSLLFLRKMVQSFFSPAETAIIQGILKKDEYLVAIGLNQVVSSVMTVLGVGIGAVAYWTVGIEGAILIDALSFFISYLLVRSSRISKEVRLPNGEHDVKNINVKIILKEYTEGLSYIWNHSLLRLLIAGYLVFGIANPLFALVPLFYLKYKLSPFHYEQYSVVEGMVIGVGLLLASLLLTAWSDKLKPINMSIGGLLFAGTTTALVGFTDSLFIFFSLQFLTAFGIVAINMGIGGWLPSIVNPSYMGRVRGCIQPIVMISGSVTLGVVSLAYPAYLSVESLFWLVGGLFLFLAVIYLFTLPGHYLAYMNKEKELNNAS